MRDDYFRVSRWFMALVVTSFVLGLTLLAGVIALVWKLVLR